MADSKISDLIEKTKRLADDDLLVVVDTEVMPQTTKKIRKALAFDGSSEVLKSTSGTIPAGSAVYLVGYDGVEDVSTVELADNTSSANMPAFGITSSEVTDAIKGIVVKDGQLRNADTSSFLVGDELYISDIPGQLTTTKPQGTSLIQKIGVVLQSSASDGVIQIFGAGRSNDLPNIADGNVWVGDSNGVPQETNLDTQIAANPDISSNTTHRSSDGKDHSDVVANNAHRVSTGNPHSATTDDIPQGSTNRYYRAGWLQYNHSVQQTTGGTLLLNFNTDTGSFANGRFTKLSATQFRADFNGFIKISYAVSGWPSQADRGSRVRIVKNTVAIPTTGTQMSSSNSTDRQASCAGSFVVSCVNGDIFELELFSIEGSTITVEPNRCHFLIETELVN